MAKMNYNSWFFNQHKYHIGSREGVSNFIDNKWVNFNDRFRSLQDIHSSLLDEQPFVVNGNNVGFDKLIDLMGRSNYTFDDLDKSMKDTYRMSLQNTMSRNIVNTHAVMFHTSNLDKKNVTADKFTHYKIIDAPFNQLHFGHRDEFIRQKLSEMHNTEFRNYTSIDKFNSSEFSRILGFSIICTVNGYFCNDCLIAIDDKGFKFKVGWPYASDVDFIVYKLDHSTVVSRTLNVADITSGKPIPYSVLNVNNDLNGMKCIVNLYDNNFIKTTPSVPNFGIFTDEGFVIRNLQGKTIETFNRQKTSTVSIDIYALKFFHEIPDLYPAVNYLDIMDTRLVYDEKYERIKTPEGRRVIASTTSNINYLETCTPPIAIDRNTTYSFDIIISCLSLYDDLIKFNNDLKDTGKCILQGTESDFFNNIERNAPELERCYKISKKAAKVGFEWPDLEGVFDKVKEELSEVKNAYSQENLEEELGDLLFSVVNLCRYQHIKPQDALQNANNKFIKRFNLVYKMALDRNLELEKLTPKEWDKLWNKAKLQEKLD